MANYFNNLFYYYFLFAEKVLEALIKEYYPFSYTAKITALESPAFATHILLSWITVINAHEPTYTALGKPFLNADLEN